MADIKEFVSRQTGGLNIGVPRKRTEDSQTTQNPDTGVIPNPNKVQTVQAEEPVAETTPAQVSRPIGRPKSGVEKVKLSAYVTAEVKEKLIKIQHHSYKSNLNDVLVEAIMQYLENHE